MIPECHLKVDTRPRCTPSWCRTCEAAAARGILRTKKSWSRQGEDIRGRRRGESPCRSMPPGRAASPGLPTTAAGELDGLAQAEQGGRDVAAGTWLVCAMGAAVDPGGNRRRLGAQQRRRLGVAARLEWEERGSGISLCER